MNAEKKPRMARMATQRKAIIQLPPEAALVVEESY
jgi:hypothetical protein